MKQSSEINKKETYEEPKMVTETIEIGKLFATWISGYNPPPPPL